MSASLPHLLSLVSSLSTRICTQPFVYTSIHVCFSSSHVNVSDDACSMLCRKFLLTACAQLRYQCKEPFWLRGCATLSSLYRVGTRAWLRPLLWLLGGCQLHRALCDLRVLCALRTAIADHGGTHGGTISSRYMREHRIDVE